MEKFSNASLGRDTLVCAIFSRIQHHQSVVHQALFKTLETQTLRKI